MTFSLFSDHKWLKCPADIVEKASFDHQQAPRIFLACPPKHCDPCEFLRKRGGSKQAPPVFLLLFFLVLLLHDAPLLLPREQSAASDNRISSQSAFSALTFTHPFSVELIDEREDAEHRQRLLTRINCMFICMSASVHPPLNPRALPSVVATLCPPSSIAAGKKALSGLFSRSYYFFLSSPSSICILHTCLWIFLTQTFVWQQRADGMLLTLQKVLLFGSSSMGFFCRLLLPNWVELSQRATRYVA